MAYNKLNKKKYRHKGGSLFGRRRKNKKASINNNRNAENNNRNAENNNRNAENNNKKSDDKNKNNDISVEPNNNEPNNVVNENNTNNNEEESYNFKETLQKGFNKYSTVRDKIGKEKVSNMLGLTELNEDNENKEKAQMLKDKQLKIQKKSEGLAKSPAEHLLDVFYNFGYNIVSMYIYITTTMINLPNSTLETIIPEKDGCHLLFGDKSTCKKKIKCLFKKCTILEDKTGYILDYKKMQEDKASRDQKGGLKDHLDESCEYKSISCNPHEKTNYNKKMPMSLLPFLTNSSKEAITTEAKKFKDELLPVLSRVNQIKFIGGTYKRNMIGGDSQDRNSLAQSNMLYKIIKDHMNIKGAYKFLLLMKMMEIIYGDVSEEEFHIEESREDEKMKLFNKKPEVVHIPFPFEHALLDTPAERLECLMVHLLGETPEDFDNNPTLKTCFSCKSCTLMGQSSKVIRGLYEELVNGVNLTFSQIFDTLFNVFSKAMTISNITSDKLAIQMLLNYRLNHKAVNIGNLRDELSPNHNYSDSLLMIPKMSIKNGVDVENNDIFKQNRYVYAYLKSMETEYVQLLVFC